MHTVYYWVSYDQLLRADKSPKWWIAHGLMPVVILPRQDDLLYNPKTSVAEIADICARISALCPPEWLAAFWCCNNAGKTTLVGWDDDSGWKVFLERCRWLQSALVASGGSGVIVDGEDYQHDKDQHLVTGPMNPKTAWPVHPRIPERAAQFGEVWRSLVLGVAVASSEFRDVPGLPKFWKRAFQTPGLKDKLLLGEDFTGASWADAASKIGARYISGFSGVDQARKSDRRAWVYDDGHALLK